MNLVKRKTYIRISLLILVVFIWMGLILWRLVSLQVYQRDRLAQRGKIQRERTIKLNPKRGRIYDRNGKELAVNVEMTSIYALPTEVTNPSQTASKLAKVLPVKRSILEKRLRSNKSFVWIERKVEPEPTQQIRELKLPGIGFLKEDKRYYPQGKLASHVIGFAGVDSQGLNGLEHLYDREIRGESGMELTLIDAKRRDFLPEGITRKEATSGNDIVVNIDAIIQYIAEKELAETVRTTGAKGGSVVIMNPRSGEVLAIANQPDYDPNNFARYSESSWRNRAVTDIYEPGSTFKILLLAMALEEKVVGLDDHFYCGEGGIEVAGSYIRDHKPYGVLSTKQIIEYSSNVGAIIIGSRIGKQKLYHHVQRYGFGKKTRIDLPGESGGIVLPFRKWSGVSVGSISIGQEICVTPLQLLTIASAIANEGYVMKPRVVKKVLSRRGELLNEFSPSPVRRIISPQTAQQLLNIMIAVVERGTGTAAKLPGYIIAGKTGTAQKFDPVAQRYGPDKYVASFIGFLPANDPVIAMIVVIDEPQGSYYGGEVAAPLFKEIAQQLVKYLRIPPRQRDQTHLVATNILAGREREGVEWSNSPQEEKR
ncbi:penicillin-binding protein [bacterium (candidate division B38) B3_B38]|nr:MAG: penicillin-binding protein [bacterium (candidate division B38) B3_B38]